MDTLCLILAIIGAVNAVLVGRARADLGARSFAGPSGCVLRVISACAVPAGLWATTMLFRKRSRPEA